MITDTQEAYIIEYPQAEVFAEQQEDIFWTAKEIGMEKDLHDLHNSLTEAETHGVVTVLKLFTKYEVHVGNEYWLDFVRRKFKRPEIQRMASLFGMFELNVHAPFYNKINEVLNLNTEEFYNSYIEDKTLKGRMDWLDSQFDGDDTLYSLAVGSIVEGAVLYSNFAFLKHFQAEGKNKLVNLTAGINFSVRDENLHSLAGAWLFNTLKEESELDIIATDRLTQKVNKTCNKILEHESRIIDMIFEKGDIRGITEHQMKQFIKARLNLCLSQINLEPLYEVEYDPISKWFYKNINSGQLHDFFHKQGNNYNRDHSEAKFVW
jgi:ribonucleotide reductase beta subunit family protein with ferritin-like domain|tara:strand:+ start:2026 stop:2985 length:960 start_codon:yes stop_codon:yes gene_type:complete